MALAEECLEKNVIKVGNVSKSFPGVQALKNVSMSIRRGEVRGLVGENGAGKSTLVKCIMGVYGVDSGEITVDFNGKWVTPRNPIEARQYGLYANYQQVNIAAELTVGENYFLGKMPLNRYGLVDWKQIYEESKIILDRFNLNIDPRTRICDLSLPLQAMVTISKISTYQELRLAIFDEPTALLESDKVETLYQFIRQLRAKNIGVIYISHRLEEVMEICDTVTVLKDGELVDTLSIEGLSQDRLVSLMVGRKIEDIYDIEHQSPGEKILEVDNLSLKGKFKNITFHLRRGEILGLFGLVGAGRTEIVRCLFGAEAIDSGEIRLKGKRIALRSPNQAMAYGIGLIPENRRTQGLAMSLSVKTNINANSYGMISKIGIINLQKEKERAEYYRDRMRIRTPSIEQPVMNLSGGNQQKVVVSKLLCRDLDVFIFDEPTVGVDVGAKLEIYKLIEQLIKEGKGVIVVSSYLPEVIGLSDRIIVVAEGEITGEIKRGEITGKEAEEKLLKLASKIR